MCNKENVCYRRKFCFVTQLDVAEAMDRLQSLLYIGLVNASVWPKLNSDYQLCEALCQVELFNFVPISISTKKQ